METFSARQMASSFPLSWRRASAKFKASSQSKFEFELNAFCAHPHLFHSHPLLGQRAALFSARWLMCVAGRSPAFTSDLTVILHCKKNAIPSAETATGPCKGRHLFLLELRFYEHCFARRLFHKASHFCECGLVSSTKWSPPGAPLQALLAQPTLKEPVVS